MDATPADRVSDRIAPLTPPRPTVLLVAPSAETPGGVAAYATMLGAHVTDWDVHPIPVGNKGANENPATKLWRMFAVPLHIMNLTRHKTVGIVHLNPSLNARALVRDGLILLALRIVEFRTSIVSFHGWQPAMEKHLLQNRFLRGCFRWLLNGCARVTVLAPEFKAALEAMGVRNVGITRTMFDGSQFTNNNVPEHTGTRRSILFLSRLVREKGIYELLDAFTALAEDFPDVDLVIAGEGEERESLQACITANPFALRIRMTGYARRPDKVKLLHHCTIFALPTYYPEGMPLVVLEAMAAGKPLLTTNAGGIRHIVSAPENAIVLETVNRAAIENALRTLLKDPDYCAQIGRRNAQYAWANFEAATVSKEMEALYQAVCNTPVLQNL